MNIHSKMKNKSSDPTLKPKNETSANYNLRMHNRRKNDEADGELQDFTLKGLETISSCGSSCSWLSYSSGEEYSICNYEEDLKKITNHLDENNKKYEIFSLWDDKEYNTVEEWDEDGERRDELDEQYGDGNIYGWKIQITA